MFPVCLRHTSIHAEHLIKYDCREQGMQILLNFVLENFTETVKQFKYLCTNISASIMYMVKYS